MTRFCVEEVIVEELKEQDLNAIALLQTEANAKRQKNRIARTEEERATYIDAIKSLEVIVNDINNVHNEAEKELAAKTIQVLEAIQKALEELSLDG